MTTFPLSRHFIAVVTVAALMLAAQPYLGLWHDGTLYFGQVLSHSRVPQLAQDLFFASGSQDRYSVYSHVVKPLYAAFGQTATHITVVLCVWALLAGAVMALLRPLQPSASARLWGLLAFAVTSPLYGGRWVMGYGEPFLTGRSFAEPLLLLSLVGLVRGRWGLTLTLLALAAAFHPVMTLPVLVVIWCFAVQGDRRWLWALATLPGAGVLAAAGVAPWDGLLRRYDPYWWSLIEVTNVHVVLGNWTTMDALKVVLDLGVLWAVARWRPPDALSRLLQAAVVATVLLLGACLVLVDGLHLVLPTQLQLWRVHWVAHLLSVAVSPWLVARLWERGGLWPVSACALVLALLNSHVGSPHGPAAVALAGATCLLAMHVRQVSDAARWMACTAIGLGGVATSVMGLAAVLHRQSWQLSEAGWPGLFLLFISFPVVAMGGYAGLLTLHDRGGRAGRVAAGILSATLLVTVAGHWDQRSDLARATEASDASAPPFDALIPRDATVYWPESLAQVWGLLERPSHFASQQGAGLLFQRDTALAFGARRETYHRIREAYRRCQQGAMLANDRQALMDCNIPSLDHLVAVCDDAAPPGFIVLQARLKVPPLASWQPPAHREPPQTFHLYACRQLASKP